MNSIGSYCLFDYNSCDSCPMGSLEVGRSLGSCGTCDSNKNFTTAKYVYRGQGLLNNSPGYIISDRQQARSFITTSGLNFDSVLHNTLSQSTDEVFNAVWPINSSKMLCVVSLDDMGGLFGFYNYSINTSNNTITLSTSDAITRQDILNSPIVLNINSDGSISWKNYIFVKE